MSAAIDSEPFDEADDGVAARVVDRAGDVHRVRRLAFARLFDGHTQEERERRAALRRVEIIGRQISG